MDVYGLVEFDAAQAAQAKPVRVAPSEGFDAWVEEHAPEMREIAAANGFAGQAGRVLAGPSSVLAGGGDGTDPFAIAAASERLPAGRYRLAGPGSDANAGEALRLTLLGWALGAYRFERYRAQAPRPVLVAPEAADLAPVLRDAAAAYMVRDLVNTPAGDMGPEALEAAARELAEAHGAKIEVIAGAALLEQNFPLIHAVGRAAGEAPRLLDLTWGDASAPKLTLVGKGVCFDSGGLDIKSAAGMLIMKKDMGGAANTLGLARLIMEAGVKVRLRVLIPAVENAISAGAYRPGDIIRSRKGITVEVGNTDAEGRLVLADAVAYGAEENPDALITLATLTGAARVALGPHLPAMYTDDDGFAAATAQAGLAIGDPVWRMPLWRPYEEMLDSDIADTNNMANSPHAGSITAALFLRKFAPDNGLWVHFDIFAWNSKARPGRPKGGEAQSIRALFAALSNRYT